SERSPPTETAIAPDMPGTCAGRESVETLSGRCSCRWPQLQTVPSARTAKVVEPAAEIATTWSRPAARPGEVRCTAPSPAIPSRSLPNIHSDPSFFSTRLNPVPGSVFEAAPHANAPASSMAMGAGYGSMPPSVEGFPSCPFWFDPHVNTFPSERSAIEWDLPAHTATMPPRPPIIWGEAL